MLRVKFGSEVDCITGIIKVYFHRLVGECEGEGEGVLSPAIVRCVRVVWVVSPGNVGTVGVHDCCGDTDFRTLIDAEPFLT